MVVALICKDSSCFPSIFNESHRDSSIITLFLMQFKRIHIIGYADDIVFSYY